PPSITFGWTAGTGGADDIHEITDVVVKTLYDTTTFAQSVPSTPIPTGGSPSVTLGNIEIDESEAGVLTAGGEIFLVLPSPLTFAGATPVAPTVSTLLSNGLTVGPAQFTSEAFDAIKFAITQASTSGAAKIVISNISVAVPSDNLPAMCAGGPFPSGQNPVCVSGSGRASSGFRPTADIQIGTLLTGPTVTSTSVNAVAEGTTVTITLSGTNLCDFVPGTDTIDFGSGISVVGGSISVCAGGSTTVTLQIQVAADA